MLTHERKQEILNKIDWEGGFDSYFIDYGADPKDLKSPIYADLVAEYKKAYENLKGFLGELAEDTTGEYA